MTARPWLERPWSIVSGIAVGLLVSCPVPLARGGWEDDPLAVRVERAALAMQRQSWEQGILAQAYLEAGADDMLVKMARGSLIHVAKDGRVATLGGSPLDCLMCGEPLVRAAKITGDPALAAAVDGLLGYVLERAPRTADGTLYHYDACLMSDSCHTAAPFLAALGRHDEARKQVDGYRRRLWDAEARLYRAIWDESKQAFARRDFWGVGNGWVACTLTRMIRALPGDRAAEREPLVAHLRDLLAGYEMHYYLAYRAARLGYAIREIPVLRAYPPTGKTPTKIHGFRANFGILQTLLKVCVGGFNPVTPPGGK